MQNLDETKQLKLREQLKGQPIAVDWKKREGVIVGFFQISNMFEITSEKVDTAERRISITRAKQGPGARHFHWNKSS
jgi:hypothetical protein